MMTRRSLWAGPLLAWPIVAAAPAAPRLVLGPGMPGPLEASLFLAGGAVFTCPPGRAVLLAVLPMRGMDVAVVSFAADPPGGAQDLLGFVADDGRLLALERRFWRSQDEDELSTRLSMLPDRMHIALIRTASRRDVRPQRSAWTDYLRCEAGCLIDAPQHPGLPGSWQDFLAVQRRAVAASLAAASHAVTPSMLAGFARSALP